MNEAGGHTEMDTGPDQGGLVPGGLSGFPMSHWCRYYLGHGQGEQGLLGPNESLHWTNSMGSEVQATKCSKSLCPCIAFPNPNSHWRNGAIVFEIKHNQVLNPPWPGVCVCVCVCVSVCVICLHVWMLCLLLKSYSLNFFPPSQQQSSAC